jgi:hypothetical protein
MNKRIPGEELTTAAGRSKNPSQDSWQLVLLADLDQLTANIFLELLVLSEQLPIY